jgi:hypothetical protein
MHEQVADKPKRTAAERRAKVASGISSAQLRYTTAQAKILLAIGNTKFWEEVRRGRIKVYRDGKCSFVDRAELERYVAERRPA